MSSKKELLAESRKRAKEFAFGQKDDACGTMKCVPFRAAGKKNGPNPPSSRRKSTGSLKSGSAVHVTTRRRGYKGSDGAAYAEIQAGCPVPYKTDPFAKITVRAPKSASAPLRYHKSPIVALKSYSPPESHSEQVATSMRRSPTDSLGMKVLKAIPFVLVKFLLVLCTIAYKCLQNLSIMLSNEPSKEEDDGVSFQDEESTASGEHYELVDETISEKYRRYRTRNPHRQS